MWWVFVKEVRVTLLEDRNQRVDVKASVVGERQAAPPEGVRVGDACVPRRGLPHVDHCGVCIQRQHLGDRIPEAVVEVVVGLGSAPEELGAVQIHQEGVRVVGHTPTVRVGFAQC